VILSIRTMSSKVSSVWVAGLVLAASVGGVGCKKPPAVDPAAIQAAESLPGAAEVRAAVEKKDFEGVLTAISKVREQVTNDEQNIQFLLLARQTRDRITELAPEDPKAMEIVATLRALSTGGR